MSQAEPTRFLYLKLAPGVRSLQIIMLVLTGLIMTLVTYVIPTMQPYVMEHQLHLSPKVFGQVGGMLAMVQNVVMLVLAPVLGALYDRIGPRILMIASMVCMGLGLFAYPFVTDVAEAVAVNVVVGLGMSAFYAGFGPCLYSYSDDSSRGKLTTTLMVTQILASGLMVGLIGANLPRWLGSTGLSPVAAGGAVFWIQAATCIVGLFLSRIGFETWKRATASGRPRPMAEVRQLLDNFGEVFAHAKAHPRFGMLLAISCAFRSDFVVVLTFLSMWVVRGAAGSGVVTRDAMSVVGSLLVVMQSAYITGALISGALADRVDRARLLLASLTIAIVAFGSPILISNVLGWPIYVVVAMLGFSEGMTIVATQSLLGQETPAHLRGSTVGAYTVVGMLSSMAVNAIGGILFDKLTPVAPFLMVAVINAACLIACCLPGPQSFLLRHPAKAPAAV